MGHCPSGDSYHDRFYYTDEEFDVQPLKQAFEEQMRRETVLWKRRESQDPTLP